MKKDNRNRGFTLVELLITVVILAIIVAPFLGLFVAASGSNVSASRKQDAANLAEDIAEEIKGKTLDALMNDPDFVCSESSGNYTFNITGSALLGGINGLCAQATLVPNKDNPINKEMPILENMSGKDTVLFMSGFYASDSIFGGSSSFGADSRKSTITITKDSNDKYMVSLEVGYYKGGILIDGSSEVVSDSDERDELPSIFAIYPPMSNQDEIYLINELEEDDMPKDENDEILPLEFYLSVQKGGNLSGITLTSSKIKIKELKNSSQEDIVTYLNDPDRERYINIYTDVNSGSLVKEQQKDKLYDLTVVVKRGNNPNDNNPDKVLANFKSSKLRFD